MLIFRLLYVKTEDEKHVVAKIEGNSRTQPKKVVHLAAKPEKLHIFDDKGISMQA